MIMTNRDSNKYALAETTDAVALHGRTVSGGSVAQVEEGVFH